MRIPLAAQILHQCFLFFFNLTFGFLHFFFLERQIDKSTSTTKMIKEEERNSKTKKKNTCRNHDKRACPCYNRRPIFSNRWDVWAADYAIFCAGKEEREEREETTNNHLGKKRRGGGTNRNHFGKRDEGEKNPPQLKKTVSGERGNIFPPTCFLLFFF